MSTREFKYVLTNRPATGNQSVYSAFAKREKQGILGLVEGVEAIVLVLDENCALGALRANKRTGRFLTRMQTDTTEELDDRLRQFLDFVVQKCQNQKIK